MGENPAFLQSKFEKDVNLVTYSHRKYPQDQFQTDTIVTNLPYITHSKLKEYRNETTNPYTQRYFRDKTKLSDEEFCDMYAPSLFQVVIS